MEEEILEVTKTFISLRGKWPLQAMGEKPDFTNLKFSVKCSDNSTIKYSSWEEFQEDGGRYYIGFSDKWNVYDTMQDIVFYIEDYPEVKLTKSVKVSRIPISVEIVSYKKEVYSGSPLYTKDFNFKVKFKDGTIIYPAPFNVTIQPEFVPCGVFGKVKCTLTYSSEESGLSVSSECNLNVKEKVYSIKNIESDFGNTRFIIGGKEFGEAYYRASLEDSVKVNLKAVSKNGNHKFMKWLLSNDILQLESPTSQETILEIPMGFGEDIWVKSIWDKRVSDKYGNIFNIEDNVLTSVELNANKVEVPIGVTSIAAKVFDDADIKEILLPKTLQTIGSGAFSGCVYLTHIDIPNSVILIEDAAFEGCSLLKSIKFNQTKPFTLGSRCFKDCVSLNELDFLALKDNFKNCVFGDGENTDVWENCKIRIVKLTQGNFFKDTIRFSTESPFTIRTPGSFKVHVRSKVGTVRARVIGTTSDGSASGISQDLTKRNAYCKTFDKKSNEDIFTLSSYSYKQDYDLRESCGCYVISEYDSDFDVEIMGMGNNQFNYPLYVETYSNYRFTSNGSTEKSWIHEGGIGQGFSNWNMREFVNNILYPNIITESGIRLIDLMLPIYNMRQF